MVMNFGGFKIPLLGSGKLGGGRAKAKGFQKVLKVSDFIITSGSTEGVSTDKFYKVGEYTIPAQQVINLGYGAKEFPDNQGYIYIQVKDATAGTAVELQGQIRLAVADANGLYTDVVWEESTERTDGDLADRNKMLAFPEITNYAVLGRSPREDDRIQIYMKSVIASGKFSNTNSVIYIPVTVYQ